LVQSAVGGDRDSETGGGECIDECSGWIVSIAFTPRGDEGKRKDDRKKKQYRKGQSGRVRTEGRKWEGETEAGKGRGGGRRESGRIVAEEWQKEGSVRKTDRMKDRSR
jgi:hypothetical protein